MLERLSGADSGHQALLDMIDGWLSAQEARAENTTTQRG
jgi:hypothetical protein